MGQPQITLVSGNWYKVIYADGQEVVFQFRSMDENGNYLVEFTDGTRGILDLSKPFRAIL